jgi:hypothetical protein
MQIARYRVLKRRVVAKHRLAVRIQFPNVAVLEKPVWIAAAVFLCTNPGPWL